MRRVQTETATSQRSRRRDRRAAVVLVPTKSSQRRQKGDGYPTGGKFPAGDDERWEGWAKPVFDFLSETRSHVEVQSWGHCNKPFIGRSLLYELLSWLENCGKVFRYRQGGVVYWRRT